ncbi:MAG: dCTP deaminase [Bacteroidetes bacterium]|nr:dCTP deaminase [Bacteroidota bacterium]
MIYPDYRLVEWAGNGGIVPFDPDCINPASVDLRLGNTFIDLETNEKFQAAKITITPGQAILATTLEIITIPPNAIGNVYLKSSMARQGLDHALAGLCDPAFSGTLTLELHSHRPITLHTGQRVIQLVLSATNGNPVNTYKGKYQNQRGPTRAR